MFLQLNQIFICISVSEGFIWRFAVKLTFLYNDPCHLTWHKRQLTMSFVVFPSWTLDNRLPVFVLVYSIFWIDCSPQKTASEWLYNDFVNQSLYLYHQCINLLCDTHCYTPTKVLMTCSDWLIQVKIPYETSYIF